MSEKWFTGEFWEVIVTQVTQWLITAVPSLIVLLIVAVVALKVTRFALGKTRGLMIKQLRNGKNLNTEELEKRADTLLGILGSATRIAIWAVIMMIFLRKIGIDIAPLIAGAGIIGLAVGFGAQELVRDVISGFFMLLENQVRSGDVAIINGTGGLVETVGLRTITLRDLSGVVHIFQNGKINSMSNMTKEWSAMVFDIGVAYKEDTDVVARIMKEVAEDMRNDPDFGDKILEPMEIFGVDSFGDSAVVVKGRIKTKPIMQWAVGREYRRRLKKEFDNRGIEIPFPHRTVYWGEEIQPLHLKMLSKDRKSMQEQES
ncbi:MAG: mechanosensitive ion channel family protein [Fibrobacterota bacterium]